MSKELLKQSFASLKLRLNPKHLIASNFENSLKNSNFPVQNLDSIHKIHIYGFGKAVYSMALEVEHQMQTLYPEKLGQIEINVPLPKNVEFSELKNTDTFKTNVGAKNNLPDSEALTASKSLVQNMGTNVKNNDFVIFLISGGGSALSCYPIEGINMDEKQILTKNLMAKGADIKAGSHRNRSVCHATFSFCKTMLAAS